MFMKVCSKLNNLELHCEATIFCFLIIVSDVETYCVNRLDPRPASLIARCHKLVCNQESQHQVFLVNIYIWNISLREHLRAHKVSQKGIFIIINSPRDSSCWPAL